MMEDMIVLEVFSVNGLIEKLEMELGEYYDGDAYDELIRKNNVKSKGITSVKGTQYGSQGKPYHIWAVHFNEHGDMSKSEDILEDDTLM